MTTYLPIGAIAGDPNVSLSTGASATDLTGIINNAENPNVTSSYPDTQKNIASSKDVNSGTKKELTEAEYKKEYIREAQKIALYRDPPAFPFISSRGDGHDRVTILPSAQLRVFIMGIEVSAWLTNTSLSSDASPGVIASSNSFTIQCPTDLFTLTHDNVFLNQWNLNDDFRASEQVKQSLYTQKKKNNVYEQKTLVGTWNLTVNTCIFHSSDTVRIFSHLPWTEDDAWLPVFNGYIADVSVNSDLLTGRDTINITMETISSKLNKARFLNNPYSIQTLDIATKNIRNPSTTITSENILGTGQTSKEILNLTDNYAIYRDVVNPTLYQSILTNTTLERVVAFLFYGDIDLTYREENEGVTDSLKDLAIPYEKLVGIQGNEGGKPADEVESRKFADLAKVSTKDFLIAYGSDPNSRLRPTLAMIISRLQDLASEKGTLQEKSKLEKGNLNDTNFIPRLEQAGFPLYKNEGKDFSDTTWKEKNGKQSLIWKLEVLKYIINSTLQMKSVERKVKTEGAQLKFTVGDVKESDALATGEAATVKKGSLLGVAGNVSLGSGYTYKDFNAENKNKITLTIPGFQEQLTTEIIKVEGLKSELTDDETKALTDKKSGIISFELKNGIIDKDTLKIDDSGQGLYYSEAKEITVTLVSPKENQDASISFVGKDYEFTSDYKNRYKDFLYKRGWGKLDPRLFALTREEFPRTGYPDPEIKKLTAAAEKAANLKKAGEVLSAAQIETGLKEDLIRQHALAVFLKKEIGDGPWNNKVETISLSSATKRKNYENKDFQWQPGGTSGSRIGLFDQPLGIPLVAYDAKGKSGITPIEFYSGKFWFDEKLTNFDVTDSVDADGLVYEIKNSEIVKDLLKNCTIKKSLSGTNEGIKNLFLENFSKEDKEKFLNASYIKLAKTNVIIDKIDMPVGGLYSLIDKKELDLLSDEFNAYIKLLNPPFYNIADNTIVARLLNTKTQEISGFYKYIIPVIDEYKNLPFVELYKKVSKGKNFSEDHQQISQELFKNEDDKLKKFGTAGLFGFPTVKDKFGVSFGSSKPQYSLDWNNNAGALIQKIINDAPVESAEDKKLNKSAFIALANSIVFSDTHSKNNSLEKQKIRSTFERYSITNKIFKSEKTVNKLKVFEGEKFACTGPILSFSTGTDNPSAEIYEGKLICLVPLVNNNPRVPSYFIAWAIEAYNYYKGRTGFSDVNALFNDKEAYPITGLNNSKEIIPVFNVIKPDIISDWYTEWKTDKTKTVDAYWVKSLADYEKNAEKNTAELAKQSAEGGLLFSYTAPNFDKGFCIEETLSFSSTNNATDNPYGIEKFNEDSDFQIPPSYNKIKDKISKSDPNEIRGKNLVIEAKKTFDLVAPADGILLGNENEGKKGKGDEIIYQFFVTDLTGKLPDKTIHRFIFKKGGLLFENLKSGNTLDRFNDRHWDEVKKILKLSKDEESAKILEFAKEGKDLGTPLSDVMIKRLNRLNKNLKTEYDKLGNYGSTNPTPSTDLKAQAQSLAKERLLLDFSTSTPTSSLFSPESLLNSAGTSAVGKQLSQVRPQIPDEAMFKGSNPSSFAFNRAKYIQIKNFYSELKDKTETFKNALTKLLDQDPGDQNSPTGSSIAVLPNYNKKIYPGVAADKQSGFELIYGNYKFLVFGDKKTLKFNEGRIVVTNLNDIVATVTNINGTANLDIFIENLETVIAAAESVASNSNTEGSGKAKTDLDTFKKKVEALDKWYDSIYELDGRKNGAIVDALTNAYEKNQPSVLPSTAESGSNQGAPIKKGQFLAKGIEAVTWEIYKPASNIPDLVNLLEINKNELKKGFEGTPLINVVNNYYTAMSPFAWLRKISDKELRDNQLTQSRANKQIDWAYEEYFMGDWHKKCAVGFANGIPRSSLGEPADAPAAAPSPGAGASTEFKIFYNNEINGLDADAVECLKAADERLNPFLTYDEVTIIGNNSGWEGIYSPHGKTVTVALRSPKYGWGINGGLEPLQYQTIDYDSPITTKGSILSDIMERLDYFWWVNGNGDVIIDFPHYELIPSHYGPKWEAFFQLEGLSTTITYSENFRQLKSTYLFTGGLGLVNVGSGDRNMLSQNTVVFQLPNVLNRNGVEVEVKTLPFITEKARLKLFGLIYLKKQIMNSFTIQMNDLPPILYLTPNTPVYHAERDVFALVSRITYNWSINDSQVTYRLQTGLTAVRQRLNYEQLTLEKYKDKKEARDEGRESLKPKSSDSNNAEKAAGTDQVIQINQDEFIRPEYSKDTRRIEARSFYENKTNTRTYSNDMLITSDKVAGFIKTDLGVRLDLQSKSDSLNPKSGLYVENERLKQIQSNYGYVYGHRDPILDYTNIYSSNQYVKGTKWQVLENSEESFVATGELVLGKELGNKIRDIDKPSSITPLAGTLKDSAEAALKVLGMFTRNIEYLIKYGPQSVDINTIDDPELRKQLQEQLDSAKTPEEKITVQSTVVTTLMNEFFDQLNTKYRYSPKKGQNDFNPQIQACLQKLNSYGGSQTAKNPALAITCRLIDYNFNLGYKFIEENYFTAKDNDSQKIFLNAVKDNLSIVAKDTDYKLGAEGSKISNDIKTVEDLIKDLDSNPVTSQDSKTGPSQFSQSIMKYPTTVDEIKAFQKEKSLEVDGKLGPRTMRALGLAGIVPKTEEEIKVFQKANKLEVDGKIGPKTQAALNTYAKPNGSQTST